MGFFGKVKQFLGMGGVKVRFDLAPQIAKGAKKIEGKIKVTTKSPQKVLSFDYRLSERTISGPKNQPKVKKRNLAEKKVDAVFDIVPGDEKEIKFTLPIPGGLKNANEQLAEKGGALGALGALSQLADGLGGVRVEYHLWVTCDVDGVTLDPNDHMELQLV